MEMQAIWMLVVIGAFGAGILLAPKVQKYEAGFASELHALYTAGALEASHVEAWFELKLARKQAELKLVETRFEAWGSGGVKDAVVAVTDVAKDA